MLFKEIQLSGLSSIPGPKAVVLTLFRGEKRDSDVGLSVGRLTGQMEISQLVHDRLS